MSGTDLVLVQRGMALPSPQQWTAMLDITREEALLLMPGGLNEMRQRKFMYYEEPEAWQEYLVRFSVRFWSKVRVNGAGDCWPWGAGRSDGGYGQIMFAPLKVMLGAHRISHAMHAGASILRFHTCHTCDNPPCCNPAHFFSGTHLENVRDCVAKGRFNHVPHLGSENGRSILTEDGVRAIKHRLAHGEGQTQIARSLGVRAVVIWRIANGVTWKHVAEGEV